MSDAAGISVRESADRRHTSQVIARATPAGLRSRKGLVSRVAAGPGQTIRNAIYIGKAGASGRPCDSRLLTLPAAKRSHAIQGSSGIPHDSVAAQALRSSLEGLR